MGVRQFFRKGGSILRAMSLQQATHRSPVFLATRMAIEPLECRVFLSAAITTQWQNPTGDVTTGAVTQKTFEVHFFDSAGTFNPASAGVATTNIIVTGPTQLIVGSAVATQGASPSELVATYTVHKAGNAPFLPADNGQYNVTLKGGDVHDTSTPPNTDDPGAIGGGPFFLVNAPPAITVQYSNPFGDITTAGGTTKDFQVTYFSDAGFSAVSPNNFSTFRPSNVTVTDPKGNTLRVTGATVVTTPPPAGQTVPSVIVTYTVQAPGGLPWNPNDNGQYNIDLVGGQVRDAQNQPNDPMTAIGFFLVNVPDTTPPVALPGNPVAVPVTVRLAGAETVFVNVTYSDDVAVDVSTINTSNITVTGPTGAALQIVNAKVAVNTNGTPRTVTYTVQNPNGKFTTSDNGIYTISVNGGVADTSGNVIVPQANVEQFTVALPDVAGPVVSGFTAPDVTTPGQTVGTVTLTYADDVGINLNTIQPTNISILGANGLPLTVLSAVPDTTVAGAKQTTVTYTFERVGGGAFTSGENTTYTVTLNSEVADLSRHVVGSTILGTFKVNVSPGVAPRQLGRFGDINGTNVPLVYRSAPDGAVATLRLRGGAATATTAPDSNLLDLTLDAGGGLATLTITTANKNPLQLGNVFVPGALAKLVAKTSELHGTIYAGGSIGSVTVLNDFGNVVSAGPVNSVTVVRGMTGAKVLSGTNLGTDGLFGGTGAAADTYNAGFIGQVKVGSAISGSFVGAGINPGPDGSFGLPAADLADDRVIGGAASAIDSVIAADVDATTRFEAGLFGTAKIKNNRALTVASNPPFLTPPTA